MSERAKLSASEGAGESFPRDSSSPHAAAATIVGLAAALPVAALAAAAQAPPSAAAAVAVSANFDTSKTMELSGTVAAMNMANTAHVYLILEVPGAAGQTERWAVQGNPAAVLIKQGWKFKEGPVRTGAKIRVVAYRAKLGVKFQESIAPTDTRLLEIAKAGRIVHGAGVTAADGTKMPFGEK